MSISRFRVLRSVFLPLLKISAVNFTLRHHWTGEPLRLNSFRHKGYWFHGKNREGNTMRAFQCMLSRGDTVVEVGGHIGYLSLWFANLVGSTGRIFVFEPGSNNLPYIRQNISSHPNIRLIEKGCGAEETKMKFYEDDLTGQNNSFVADFKGLKSNAYQAPGVSVEVRTTEVDVCRLDAFIASTGRPVNFVKIDTEGYEWPVLQGCTDLFNQTRPPIFMVEVQADESLILKLFQDRGYKVFDARSEPVGTPAAMRDNIFMLHPQFHDAELKRWTKETNRK